jgi:uncharacterized membrane protein
MTWFIWALGAAFGMGTADFFLKRWFSDRPAGEMAMARVVSVLPLSLALLIGMPRPEVKPDFYLAVGLALPAEVAATLLYHRAIKLSPLALAQPFLAFTPVFAVATGLFFLGELPTAWGMVGVALLTAGAYGLNLEKARLGWRRPFLAVFQEPGSWMMLAVSALYAYTAVLGRKAVLASTPLFMLAVYPPLHCLALGTVMGVTRRLRWGWMKRSRPLLGLMLAMSAMALCHFFALELVQTAYMISVKRLSILFATIYGGLFLGEKRLFQHLGAAGVMVAGAAVMLILG